MSEKETAEKEALKNNTHVVADKRVFGIIKFCGKCCGIWRESLSNMFILVHIYLALKYMQIIHKYMCVPAVRLYNNCTL